MPYIATEKFHHGNGVTAVTAQPVAAG